MPELYDMNDRYSRIHPRTVAAARADGPDELVRNRRLAENIAAGRSPLDDEIMATLRQYVEANLDVPGPRVGQLLAEMERLQAMEQRAKDVLSEPPVHATDHAARGTAWRILGYWPREGGDLK